MTLWFVSDTHFGHANIINYCQRPFASTEEMDEAMIERWNAVVRPSDHIYHLGDVAMRKADLLRVMPRLVGHKRLVRGNHDIFPTKEYLKFFDEIHGVRVFDRMVFSHFPLHPTSIERFAGNIHGHIHELEAFSLSHVNISVEQTNYTPITLDQVKALLAQRISGEGGERP